MPVAIPVMLEIGLSTRLKIFYKDTNIPKDIHAFFLPEIVVSKLEETTLSSAKHSVAVD